MGKIEDVKNLLKEPAFKYIPIEEMDITNVLIKNKIRFKRVGRMLNPITFHVAILSDYSAYRVFDANDNEELRLFDSIPLDKKITLSLKKFVNDKGRWVITGFVEERNG